MIPCWLSPISFHRHTSRHHLCSPTTLTIPRLLYLCPLECGASSCTIPLGHAQSQTSTWRNQPNHVTRFYRFRLGKLSGLKMKHRWACIYTWLWRHSWQARKQKTVAASSCEAEYVAAFEACKEAIWLRTLLGAIGYQPQKPTNILCDNNAAINLSEDPLLHDRVKHIDIKHHFLQEHVQSQEIFLSYINTHDNIADIFTKALETKKFTRFREFLGIKPSKTPCEEECSR